jgi:hypothetical protein
MTGLAVFNQPWLTIRWDSEHQCVNAKWRAFANSNEFRAAAFKVLEVIRQNRTTALVSDNRELVLVLPEDQIWIQETWTPLAVEAGLKRIAVIVAPTGLGRYASEEIINHFPGGTFVTRTFDSLDEALIWAADANQ